MSIYDVIYLFYTLYKQYYFFFFCMNIFVNCVNQKLTMSLFHYQAGTFSV